MILKGRGVSSGIGLGRTCVIQSEATGDRGEELNDEEFEQRRLEEAIRKFHEITDLMSGEIEEVLEAHEGEILKMQGTLLKDKGFIAQIYRLIGEAKSAEMAVSEVCEDFANKLRESGDKVFSERASDILDVKERLVWLLSGRNDEPMADINKNTVLVVKELMPSMMIQLKKVGVAAVLTEEGGFTSHSAILARAMGIPVIQGIKNVTVLIKNGEFAVADGMEGIIEINPSVDCLGKWLMRQMQWKRNKDILQTFRNQPTLDASGVRYQIFANVGHAKGAQRAFANGAEGIGLFRTEFLFMEQGSFPTVDEQVAIYTEMSAIMKETSVSIRLLDICGDKDISYLGKPGQSFSAYNDIRDSFGTEKQELYEAQLRALLISSASYRNISILLPMVRSIEDVRQVKQLIDGQKTELLRQGIPFDEGIKVGVMIETAASVQIADLLSSEVDFFSIGTNDLPWYILAPEFPNARSAGICSVFHPAVLRAIRSVVRNAKKAGIPVSVCGESAADYRMIPLLMAWGLPIFSVGAESVLAVRKYISSVRLCDAKAIESEAMACGTTKEVLDHLKRFVFSKGAL